MAKDDRRTMVLALLVVVIIAVPVVVFASMQNDNSNPTSSTVDSDALGRMVNVTSFARVVSCAPDITETVYAMGHGDDLVGVTTFCDFPQDVLDRKVAGTLTEIGGYWDPSIEQIVDLEPNLVLISSGVQTHLALIDRLEAKNISVVAFYPGKNLDEVFTNIDIMGQVFNDAKKASQLTAEMSSNMNKIKAITSVHTIKPKVLFAVWLDPLYTTGGATYVSDIITGAGGTNVFGYLTGWPQPSMEKVVEVQPDYIIVSGTMMLMTPEQIIESMHNDPIWGQTPAVKTGHVYVVAGQAENCFLRQGVRMVDAMHLLAEILFPNDFSADVPNTIGSEYQNYLTPLPDYASGGMTMLTPMAMTQV